MMQLIGELGKERDELRAEAAALRILLGAEVGTGAAISSPSLPRPASRRNSRLLGSVGTDWFRYRGTNAARTNI
jgi:hypothetical protein